MKEIADEWLLKSYFKSQNLQEIFTEKLIADMKLFSFEKGEIVCSGGDTLTHLSLLVDGKLKVYTILPNGKSLLLRFINPLGIIGDVELMTGYEVRNTVESLNDSIMIRISFVKLHEFAENEPKFLNFIIKNLSHKLYTLSNTTSLNLLYPVENKFASYLVSTMVDENNYAHIEELKTSKLTEFAELLGTSYRHLNRVINQLVSKGIIERKRGAILIKDVNQLMILSKGNLYE
ncbi:transcriptional regulator [Bacillus canaveralius]|uniref:Transcriptional regulator n=1 Tax=Bacillus canaveralius TaxID=1403243 RepID=A0A2N5GS24_9BACI|nr:cyclic nucleotide-binding domain-containing protein [Bacillus canaveralius]PLR86347.1 transcriptional regulator [Bacillus canaveralius]PLR98580.1 transcriptional regulator [Bacillus canaveralius]